MSYIPYSRADLMSADPILVSGEPSFYNVSEYNVDASQCTSGPHVTKGTEILNCRDNITIILNTTPKDRETVLVKLKDNSTIKIIGNINLSSSGAFFNEEQYNIDQYGSVTITMNTQDTSRTFIYVKKFNEWYPYYS